MAKSITWAALRAEYEELWATCKLVPSKTPAAMATAKKIAANKARYESVSRETSVPWYVIGLIHAMECGLSFKGHLHNGDSLQARTWQVPKGRPKSGSPPFTWEESAIDAIRYDGLDKVKSWEPSRLCFELEGYNGWGYRKHHPNVKSPYLWSGTNHYTSGKYVADGKWSSTAVSGQSGAITILRCLMEIDHSLDAEAVPAEVETPDLTHPTPVRVKDVIVLSRKACTLNRILKGFHALWVSFAAGSVLEYFDYAKDILTRVNEFVADHKRALMITGAILGALAIKYILALMKEDVLDGRYTPSRQIKV